MDSRTYFHAYVEQCGGVPQTALRLAIPYPTIAAIANGGRGISKAMADRMVKADPLLDKNRLVWVTAEKPAPAADRSEAA